MRGIIKTLIPSPLRHIAWKTIDFVGYPLLGFIFTLIIRKYRTEDCVFNYPRQLTNFRFRSRFLLNNYEQDERNLLKKYLKSGDRVIEFGACIGIVSCITNKKINPEAPKRHVVVEANPQLIPFLYANRSLNECNFLIEHGAVGDGDFSRFHFHKLIVGGSINRETGNQTLIVNQSLQDLNEKYGEFDVLMMDIEGGEYAFLLKSENSLEQFRLVLIEIHNSILGREKADECRTLLAKSGFVLKERLSQITEAWERI